MFNDGQSEAGATGFAGTGFVDAVEALEDAAEMLFRHALAEILDVKLDRVIVGASADYDAAARDSVLHGIFNEVAKDLGHGIDVGKDHGVDGIAGFESDTRIDNHTSQGLNGILDEGGGAYGLNAGLVLAGFDLGESEEVFSKAVHPAGIFENDVHELARVIGEIHLVFEEGFDVSGDGCERGAKLMGDVGDEVAAGFLRALDLGDIVEDGYGTAIGGGGGADLEGAAGDDGDGSACADATLAERGVHAAENFGIADADDEGLARTDGARGDALHHGIGPADLSGGVDGDDGFLHGIEESSELALLAVESVEGVLEAAGGGVEGAGDFADFVAVILLDACREIAGGNTAREFDDTAQAAGDAMRKPCGCECGEDHGDERGGKQVAAQNVEGGSLLHRAEGGHAGFFVERMRDDVAERKVQHSRGDAQHEEEGEKKLGEDSAGHGGIEGTGYRVQGSADMSFSE